jgi:hypothetical protein
MIAGAGLDVLEQEPPGGNNPLRIAASSAGNRCRWSAGRIPDRPKREKL